MARSIILLILCFIVSGFGIQDDECVMPGLRERDISVSISVPVRKHKEDMQIFWVDSNQTIEKGKIKFSISGSINLCPFGNDDEILVPSAFCSDNSEPNYLPAKDSNDDEWLDDHWGLDASDVCYSKEFGNGTKRYVSTKITVNPGDRLTFNLVPRKVEIDCNRLKLLKKISLGRCYDDDNKLIDPDEICEGGEFLCEVYSENDTGIKNGTGITNKQLHIKPVSKEKVSILVGNGYTPYDNKVYFDKNSQWMSGALLDLRHRIGAYTLLSNIKMDLDALEENREKELKKYQEKVEQYQSYELNCFKNRICYNQSGGVNHGDCVASVRYKRYSGTDGECSMYASNLGDIDINSKDFFNGDALWAEALVAKITPPGDENDSDDSYGTQCLPGNGKKCTEITDNFKDFSLQLGHEYEVNDAVARGSGVKLAIASKGNNYLHRGGYNVKVNRLCNFNNGKNLYFYLGDNPPQDLSALKEYRVDTVNLSGSRVISNGRISIKRIGEDGNMYELQVLDENGLSKPQKIYFGIDVSNAEKNDIELQGRQDQDQRNQYSYDNNKYEVTLFLQKGENTFISSTINKIFNYVKGKDSTQSKDSLQIAKNVKSSYKRFGEGFALSIRAAFVLYIIFSVMGYMFGTIQLSKYDFIMRIIKISFVFSVILSDTSWEFFGKKLSTFFIDGSNYLIGSFSGYYKYGEDKNNNFAFLDSTLGVLITWETWLKILSLFFAGPFGFIAMGIMIYATVVCFKCMLSAVVKYVIAIVLVGFLISLAPLFIVFLLFQRTQGLFFSWISTMAQISLQPVILFSSLALLTQLLVSVLYNLTNFTACAQCLLDVKVVGHKICLFTSMLPIAYGNNTAGFAAAMPIDLVQVFIYLIIVGVIDQFVDLSGTMSQAMLRSGHGATAALKQITHGVSQAALSTVGADDETQYKIRDIKNMLVKRKVEMAFNVADDKAKGDGKNRPGETVKRND